MTSKYIKLFLAIIFDIIDFTYGRIIGIGTVTDVVMVVVAFIMFGWKGLLQIWEAVELTDQVDGFVPTMTILALLELREGKKGKQKAIEGR